MLITYELVTRSNYSPEIHNNESRRFVKTNKQDALHVPIFAFIGALTGLLLALPPLTSDIFWRKAQVAQSLSLIEQSMVRSYFNPQNTQKFVSNIDALERSQIYDKSREYALQAVEWNPNSFDLWKLLYLIRDSTEAEKKLAINNMKRLDPLNPDVTATQ